MKEQLGKNLLQFYSEKIEAAIGLWLILSSGNRVGSVIVVVDHEERNSLRMGMLWWVLAASLWATSLWVHRYESMASSGVMSFSVAANQMATAFAVALGQSEVLLWWQVRASLVSSSSNKNRCKLVLLEKCHLSVKSSLTTACGGSYLELAAVSPWGCSSKEDGEKSKAH